MQTIEFNLEWKLKLQNRFINYAKIYSTSDPESESTPSTPQQWNIAKYIFEELQGLGLELVELDGNGYIYALYLLTWKRITNLPLDLLRTTTLRPILMART